MTEFFNYANLTWPEIADLPRHTPLVIPLGEGFTPDYLTDVMAGFHRCSPLPFFQLPGFSFSAPAVLAAPEPS